jgi:hypothetical protein
MARPPKGISSSAAAGKLRQAGRRGPMLRRVALLGFGKLL